MIRRMLKPFLCKIGIHKWGRAVFTDYSIRSNILDWRQKCIHCGKRITWVQPKGLNEKFYPISWAKRKSWLFWVILLLMVYLIYRHFF